MESEVDAEASESTPDKRLDVDNDALLLAVYGVIQGFITDERPEVLSENSSQRGTGQFAYATIFTKMLFV